MTCFPVRWPREKLLEDARKSALLFREERLAADVWAEHYTLARRKFEKLFETLKNLSPQDFTDKNLAEIYRMDLGDTLRYLAGPPISDDDLRVLADVKSISPNVLADDPEALRKVYGVINRTLDPYRFPWFREGHAPTRGQCEAALLASATLLAAQRTSTERRNSAKERQESEIKNYLRDLGFKEVSPSPVSTIVKGPQKMEFCAECLLGERKADVLVRLHDTRLMAMECKVSNSSTNSVKRLNNDAAVKAEHWVRQFGTSQIVPVALLAGVFNVLNLEQAQNRGLFLFWSHDKESLGDFIQSTV